MIRLTTTTAAFFLLFFLFLSSTTQTFAITRSVWAEGKIKGPNGATIVGAQVHATCSNGTQTTSGDTTTVTGGWYHIVLDGAICDPSRTVYVSASKNGMMGGDSGKAQEFINNEDMDIDLAYFIFSVPEFGTITMMATPVIAGLAFIAMRKKLVS